LLYLPHESPHGPFQRRLDRALRIKNSAGEDQTYRKKLKIKDSIWSIRKEMIEVMDEGIGRIINTLKEQGLEKQTLVLFCSDNGAPKYGSNRPLKGGKGSIYEGGHRVPAIAWWPETILRGKEVDETILTMDIYPTLLDISKTKKTSKLDGQSFKKVLLHQKHLKKRKTFWKYNGKKAVRFGEYKLITYPLKGIIKTELYNLKEDVGETDNILRKYPKMAAYLLKALSKWEKEVSLTQSLTTRR